MMGHQSGVCGLSPPECLLGFPEWPVWLVRLLLPSPLVLPRPTQDAPHNSEHKNDSNHHHSAGADAAADEGADADFTALSKSLASCAAEVFTHVLFHRRGATFGIDLARYLHLVARECGGWTRVSVQFAQQTLTSLVRNLLNKKRVLLVCVGAPWNNLVQLVAIVLQFLLFTGYDAVSQTTDLWEDEEDEKDPKEEDEVNGLSLRHPHLHNRICDMH